MMNLVDVLCRDFPKFILHGEVALSISAPHIQPIFWLILATYYLKILLFFLVPDASLYIFLRGMMLMRFFTSVLQQAFFCKSMLVLAVTVMFKNAV